MFNGQVPLRHQFISAPCARKCFNDGRDSVVPEGAGIAWSASIAGLARLVTPETSTGAGQPNSALPIRSTNGRSCLYVLHGDLS